MASISHNKKNGHRAIQFVTDGKRRTIRLGKVSKRMADAVKLRFEKLIAAKVSGHVVDNDTAGWLADIADELHIKLASHGLTHARRRSTLKAFADEFIEKHRVEPRTRYTLELARDNLVASFGEDRRMESITKGEGQEWRQFLLDQGSKTGKPLSENTTNLRCGKASQIFQAAIDYEIIQRNPLLGLQGTFRSNRERQYFVTPHETEKLLDVCLDGDC